MAQAFYTALTVIQSFTGEIKPINQGVNVFLKPLRPLGYFCLLVIKNGKIYISEIKRIIYLFILRKACLFQIKIFF